MVRGCRYRPRPHRRERYHNFTAFANEDNTDDAVFTEAKTNNFHRWYNKIQVGEPKASYVGLYFATQSGVWSAGANGGLSPGLTRSDYSNAGEKGLRVQLTDSWFDNDDVFLESSAVYTNFSDASTSSINQASTKHESFRFGVLRGSFFPRLCAENSLRLCTTWRAGHGLGYGVGIDSQIFTARDGTSAMKANKDYSAIVDAGLTMYLQKTTTEEAGTNYISYAAGYNTGDITIAYAAENTAKRFSESDHAAVYKSINDDSSRASQITLYQRMSIDLQTIRVYTGGALTRAEKAYNHLIDLLGFYQVEIPFGLTPDSLMPIAAEYMGTIFAYGDPFDEIRSDLTASLSSVATVACGGETRYYCVPADGLALADYFKDMTVFGYRIDGVDCPANTLPVLTVPVDVTVFATDAVKISSTVDVAVLGSADSAELAEDTVFLRFNALVDKEQFLALGEAENFSVTEMGILITPLTYIRKVAEFNGITEAEAFNKETLSTWYDLNSTYPRDITGAYLDVAAGEFRLGHEAEYTDFTLSGGFGHFSNATLDNDPYFAAVAYFHVDLDGDMRWDTVVYGVFEESKCVKVTEILEGAMEQIDDSTHMFEVLQTLRNEFYERELARQE